MDKTVRLIFVLATSSLLTACANLSAGNLFSHYSAQNSELHQSLAQGRYQEAQSLLADDVAGEILDNMEKGRVYLLNQQYRQSKQALEQSDQAVRELQDKATISLSQSALSLSALAVNDSLKSYQPADYELGFLHLYLGLNYLQKNDLEGALVEMRRANQVQELARKKRQSELESAEAQMQAQGVSSNLGSVLANYPDAGEKLQAVQNGYLFYLSALLYETNNDLNNAYVDCRRALAVMPNNQQVIESTMRVAKKLEVNQDLIKLEKRYGQWQGLKAGKARVLLIEEQGVVDAMQGWNMTLPIASANHSSLYNIALPYYGEQQPNHYRPISLNQRRLTPNLVSNVNLMARQNLTERMPTLLIRQGLRVWAKQQLKRQVIKDQSDSLGGALFDVWNTLTEQPDTRSWLTLPAEIYTASAEVAAGEQSLQVGGQNYSFTTQSGHTTLVWLSRQGDNAIIWHKQLGDVR